MFFQKAFKEVQPIISPLARDCSSLAEGGLEGLKGRMGGSGVGRQGGGG